MTTAGNVCLPNRSINRLEPALSVVTVPSVGWVVRLVALLGGFGALWAARTARQAA